MSASSSSSSSSSSSLISESTKKAVILSEKSGASGTSERAQTDKTDGTLDDDDYVYEEDDIDLETNSNEIIRIGIDLGPGSATPVLNLRTASPINQGLSQQTDDVIPLLDIPRLYHRVDKHKNTNDPFSSSSSSSSSSAAAAFSSSPSSSQGLSCLSRSNRYVVVEGPSLESAMIAEVAETAKLLALSEQDALLLLHSFFWKKSRLYDVWWEDCGIKVRANAGLTIGPDPPPFPTEWIKLLETNPKADIPCSVSLEDKPLQSFDALPCGHFFSQYAWHGHLTEAMKLPDIAQLTRCLYPDCKELVRMRMFQKILSRADFQRFCLFGIKRFVASFGGIAWCPGLNCASCVKALDGQGDDDTVECSRGHSFCFGCRKLAHKPATCEAMKKWDLKENEEGLSINFIKNELKARPCPKCSVSVQRESGCNKVKCLLCSHSFCFVCGGDYYKTHNYPQEAWTCNVVVSAEAKSSVPNDLEIYEAFRNRYLSAVESSKAMTDSFPKLEQSIAKLYKKLTSEESLPFKISSTNVNTAVNTAVGLKSMELEASPKRLCISSSSSSSGIFSSSASCDIGLSITDFDFILDAGRTVVNGRTAIANSYAYAFFLEQNSTEANLFNNFQSQLEGTVESLHQRVQASLLEFLINGDVDGFLAALDGRDPSITQTSSSLSSDLPSAIVRPRSAPSPSSSSLFADIGALTGSFSSRSPSKNHELRDAFNKYRIQILTIRSTAETFMRSICDAVSAGVLEGYEHKFPAASSSSSSSGTLAGRRVGSMKVSRPLEDSEDGRIPNKEKATRYAQIDLDGRLAMNLQALEDGDGGDDFAINDAIIIEDDE